MTINNDDRIAGPFLGTGVIAPYAFEFKVFATSDVVATVTDLDGNEITWAETTNYAVTLNPDQDVSPGGELTPIAALTTGYLLTLTSDVPNYQPVLLTNAGGFLPAVLNNALDRLTILVQQVAAKLSRALTFPFSDGVINTQMPTKAFRLGRVLAFDATTGEPIVGPSIIDIDAAGAAAATAVAAADSAAIHDVSAAEHATNADIASQAATNRWQFNPSTAMADPSSGLFSLNHATVASATSMAISAVSNNTGAPDLRAVINTWDDSTSSAKGRLTLRSYANPAVFAQFDVAGAVTDNTSWLQFTVAYKAGNGVFGASDVINFSFAPVGDAGTIGAGGITTSANPGFWVGPSQANASFDVDASVASSVNGIRSQGAASGAPAVLTTRGPGANVDFIARPKGSGYFDITAEAFITNRINGASVLAMTYTSIGFSYAGRDYSANTAHTFTGLADSNMTASTEAMSLDFNYSQTKTHATGAYVNQRDIRFRPSVHAFAGASALTNAYGVYIDGASGAGTNNTLTNAYGLYIASLNVAAGGGTVTNSFGGVANAQTGASNNYAWSFLGGKVLFAAATTSYASANFAPGAAPTTPVNGDFWSTSAGFFGRVNGSTVNLGGWTLGTPVATTSGTAIDFTGIPTGAKRITVMCDGISMSGTDSLGLQLGSTTIQTSGYVGASGGIATAGTFTENTFSSLFHSSGGAAASTFSGAFELALLDASTNKWMCTLSLHTAGGTAASFVGGGIVSLAGPIDRLRLRPGGANTFDAGSVNIMYQ